MSIDVVFETHSLSEDNERGIATGWLDGELSATGRLLAIELGRRRRTDGVCCVYTSDLRRAVQTAELAFAGSEIPVVSDRRLRECNYGLLNGAPRALIEAEGPRHIDERHPEGESWREAVRRVLGFLEELGRQRRGERVLVIGHMSCWYALEHVVHRRPLDELWRSEFNWREGWEYRLVGPRRVTDRTPPASRARTA